MLLTLALEIAQIFLVPAASAVAHSDGSSATSSDLEVLIHSVARPECLAPSAAPRHFYQLGPLAPKPPPALPEYCEEPPLVLQLFTLAMHIFVLVVAIGDVVIEYYTGEISKVWEPCSMTFR